MSIEWSDRYSIGVEEIDNQHKELFSRFNSLLCACKEGAGNKEVTRLLQFLGDYVVEHFSAEEKMQIACGYPDYNMHHIEHEKFKHQLADLQDQLAAESSSLYLVILTNKVLVEWLITHITKLDMEVGKYLQKPGK